MFCLLLCELIYFHLIFISFRFCYCAFLLPLWLTLKLSEYFDTDQQQIQAHELSHNFGQPSIDFAKYKRSVISILYIMILLYVGYLPMIVTSMALVFSERSAVIMEISTVSIVLTVESRFFEYSIIRNSRFFKPKVISLGFASVKHCNFSPDFSNARFFETPDISN